MRDARCLSNDTVKIQFLQTFPTNVMFALEMPINFFPGKIKKHCFDTLSTGMN